MALPQCERLYFLPCRPCLSRVVIGLQHSPDCENTEPCFGLLSCRPSQVLGQLENFARNTSRFVWWDLAHFGIERFGALLLSIEQMLRSRVQRLCIYPAIPPC